MAFALLYAEGYNNYLALKQRSKIIYWNISETSVHKCCHSTVPYNQLSEQSIIQLSLCYTTCLLNGWLGE